MRLLSAVLAAIALQTAMPAAAATALPGWLAGTWARQDGAAWSEELWTAPHDGVMLGVSLTGFGPDVERWDYVRIERAAGEPVLVVQQRGAAAVRYPLAVASDAAIEFANPAQDSAQRIRYWREGQLLMMEVSRMDGSGAQRRNYRPVATGPVD
jgi:hypothetical protein